MPTANRIARRGALDPAPAGVSRRAFLRGAGFALTLPWLESLPVRAADTGKRSSADANGRPPVRFACIYFSNGVEPIHWWAKGDGAAMEIGPGLAPMQAHREDMVFLKGLFNEQAASHKSVHLGRIPNLLSGAWVSKLGIRPRDRKSTRLNSSHLGSSYAVFCLKK